MAKIILFAIVATLIASAAVPAADPSPGPSLGPNQSVGAQPELQALIEKAKRDGFRVVVLDGTNSASSDKAQRDGLIASARSRALEARVKLREVFGQSGALPARSLDAIRSSSSSGDTFWPLQSLLLAVVFLAIGFMGERAFARWARPHFQYVFKPEPSNRAEKIGYLIVRALLFAARAVIQGAIAAVLILLADAQQVSRDTQLLIVGAVLLLRLLLIVFQGLLAPAVPSHRVLALTDKEAQRLYGGLRLVLTLSAVAITMCMWFELVGVDENAHILGLIAGTGMAAVLCSTLAVRERRTIGGLLLGADPSIKAGAGRRVFARIWHALAVVYFFGAWVATTIRLSIGEPHSLGLVGGPIVIGLFAFAVYGIALVVLDACFDRARSTPANDAGAEHSDEAESEGRAADHSPSLLAEYEHLAEKATAIVVGAAAIWLVLKTWGVDVGGSSATLGALWKILLVFFMAYLAQAALKVWVNFKIAQEVNSRSGEDAHEPEKGDMGGAGRSRLETLLPIFRSFLAAVIVVIAGLMILSELGVDITPLFAGAGVVGLAVGFGSQALIRDIFSGAFFLIDDAFRQGEYIDIGQVKGTVERISIRSMQLRHHRGALHTIPFGEIHSLTNYSRDWVIMKLPLRVTFDSDPERIRKLIKKLGEEMLEDPEIGGLFLEPLKSQGVLQVDDSGILIRVKFMTRPGDQFMVRKTALARIDALFKREGIQFARNEVNVRVSDRDSGEPLSEAEKQAVAGAAQRLVQQNRAAAQAADTAE